MRLAELMMDTAVSTVLKGKTMDEADLGEGPPRLIRWRKQILNDGSQVLGGSVLLIGERRRGRVTKRPQTQT